MVYVASYSHGFIATSCIFARPCLHDTIMLIIFLSILLHVVIGYRTLANYKAYLLFYFHIARLYSL